jgi:hypothetical protein
VTVHGPLRPGAGVFRQLAHLVDPDAYVVIVIAPPPR